MDKTFVRVGNPRHTRTYGSRCPPMDTKELLKFQMIQQGSTDNEGKKETLTEVFESDLIKHNPNKQTEEIVGFYDTYLLFDSFNKNTSRSTPGDGVYAWDISSILSNNRSLEQVVAIQIEPLHIPLIVNPDTTGNEFYFFREMYMTIKTLPDQTGYQYVYDNVKSNYHYVFDITNAYSIAPKCEPRNDNVYLTNPISTFDSFDIRLSVPPKLKPIPFLLDVVPFVAIGGSNPARIEFFNIQLTQIIPGGDVIPPAVVAAFIDNFNSTDATVNNAVTNTFGVQITSKFIDVGNPSRQILEIGALSFATITDTPGRIMIAMNRVALSVRFTSIGTTRTNNLSNVHV